MCNVGFTFVCLVEIILKRTEVKIQTYLYILKF